MSEFDPERRQLLAALVGLAGVAARPNAAAAQARRPNILFALGDDWSWTSASTQDDLTLAIPTFRRLATGAPASGLPTKSSSPFANFLPQLEAADPPADRFARLRYYTSGSDTLIFTAPTANAKRKLFLRNNPEKIPSATRYSSFSTEIMTITEPFVNGETQNQG